MTQLPVCSKEHVHADAVAKAREGMLPEKEYGDLSELYKCLADATRIRILHALEQRELCVCDVAQLLGMTKSAVSHQLRLLRMADLVRPRRDGQTVYYSLSDDHVRVLIDIGLSHIREEEK